MWKIDNIKNNSWVRKSRQGASQSKKKNKVAYLDQLASNADDDRAVYEILKDVFVEINNLEKQIKEYEKRLSKESNNQILLEKYCPLIKNFSLLLGRYLFSRTKQVKQ